eukprot:1118997_1
MATQTHTETEMVTLGTSTVGTEEMYYKNQNQGEIAMTPPGIVPIGDNDDEAEGMQKTVEGMGGAHIQRYGSTSSDHSNDDLYDRAMKTQETVVTTNHGSPYAGDANICVDCGEIKYGKIYDGDGQFYCNECWMHNNVALKRQETAGAEKDIKRFSLSETDHTNDGLWGDYGAGTPIGAMPQGAGTLGREATAGIGLIEANESHESGQCTDCGEIHPGKIYDGDGQFYCNKCWMDYAPENMDIDHFIQ